MLKQILFVTALLLVVSVQASKRGFGTAYTEAGSFTPNACEYSKGDLSGHFATYFVSVASANFNGGSACGKCIRVRGAESGATGKSILFKVVDECTSGCSSGDLDFSKTGLKQTTGFSWDEKRIVWDWAPCDGAKIISGGRSGKRGRKMMDTTTEELSIES